MKVKVSNVNTPVWNEITVKSSIPKELQKLSEIAHNIWWSWDSEAVILFRDLDPVLWKEVGLNPVTLLERMSFEKLEALSNDKVIIKRMNDLYARFKEYVDVKPDTNRPSVAYFSMEYGLSSVLKIYSGGLGVLAGDYLKEASDSNVDLCAIGFLYRYGYFNQTLSMDGQQIANYEAQNFGSLPLERVIGPDGQPLVVSVPYLDYFVHEFDSFITRSGMDLNSTFTIPQFMNSMIQKGLKVNTISTPAKWMALVSPDDRIQVILRINDLIRKGVYPQKLFELTNL